MIYNRFVNNLSYCLQHLYKTRGIASIVVPMHSKLPHDYQGAIEALNNLQTNAQYLKNALVNPDPSSKIPDVLKYLKRASIKLEDIDKLSVIHVTGTNGKGTTCAYTENILRHHGYKTGFFSSPHLLDVRERIRINGKPISKDEFSKHFWKIYDLLDSQKEHPNDMPLYFRYLTLMAFQVFISHKVDVVILEVGIGGEYDCTNIVRKTIIAGITPLDMDHVPLLGNTLESIAWNKSGIMKEGCITFTVPQPENVLNVFRNRSKEKKCTLKVIKNNYYSTEENSRIPLHIKETNASLAFAISEAFIQKDTNNNGKFSLDLAKKCITNTCWPGRYEIKQYKNVIFYIDGAHTLSSISVCSNWFKEKTLSSSSPKVLIFNLTGNRDATSFFSILAKCDFDIVIFTPNIGHDNDRADINDLKFTKDQQALRCQEYRELWSKQQETFKKQSEVVVCPNISKAVEYLGEKPQNVLVTGSIHLVGAVMSVIDPTLGGILED